MFNDYCANLREQYEQTMANMSDLNYDLQQKVTIYENEERISDMTPIDLIGLAFLRGQDQHMRIWREVKRSLNVDVFYEIVDKEFDEEIQERSEEVIKEAIQKVSQESKY